MGILNVTPDSFSDGGRFLDARAAVAHGLRLRDEGADLLDIGGESTRPGAEPVSVDEELRRVLPVIDGLRDCGAAISVDTMKPAVMREALGTGADLVNDVNALRAVGALDAVAKTSCGVCLMHMQGEPGTMQQQPSYADVVSEVREFLKSRAAAAENAGIDRDRIVVDPGFGFGKTMAHNLSLLRDLDRIADLGYPLLVGLSRKSVLGVLTGREVGEREFAGLTAAVIAMQHGARIVRVHDVAACRDAIKVLDAVENL